MRHKNLAKDVGDVLLVSFLTAVATAVVIAVLALIGKSIEWPTN